jgi:hypothetical protein
MTVTARKTAPVKNSNWNDALSFRVWVNDPAYDEDPMRWKCVAAFRFLNECLDYIAMCQDCGVDVVFQSPAETKTILAADRRVVFKPEPESAAMELLRARGYDVTDPHE